MTFLHIPDQGLAQHALGDRRHDHATAATIRAALNAPGRAAAARTLAQQQIDLAIALRILAAPWRCRQ